jgi:hypothetical protein
MVIGSGGPLMLDVSDTLVRGWSWPEVNSTYVLRVLGWAVPAGINAAIGAGVAAALDNRRRFVITLLPIAIHVGMGIWAMVEWPEGFLVFQLFALVWSVVVWPAGRLGQLIGRALRNWRVPPVVANEIQSV